MMTNRHASPIPKHPSYASALLRPGRATAALLIGAALVGASGAIARPASAGPPVDIRSLAGTWRVVAVRVSPSPVQALVANDPSYMGATLDVTPTRLSWRKPHTASSLSPACDRPRPTGGGITCRKGSFGPPGTRVTRSGKRLAIGWYDGGTLILARIR